MDASTVNLRENQSTGQYFATLRGARLAEQIFERFHLGLQDLHATRRHDRIWRSYREYYGLSQDGNWVTSSDVGTGGEQGELTVIKVNHYREFLKRILTMATSQDPAFEAQAVNTDAESAQQAILANGLCDYYTKAKGYKRRRVLLTERALVCGEAWLGCPWDPNRGEAYGVEEYVIRDGDGPSGEKRAHAVSDDPESGGISPDDIGEDEEIKRRTVFEGDFRFNLYTPYTCQVDPEAEDRSDPDWLMVADKRNRWDLIALYPQLEEKIKGLPPASESLDNGLSIFPEESKRADNGDHVYVYTLYHRKTPAVPDGLIVSAISPDTLLGGARPMAYQRIPVFRSAVDDVIDTPGGYTPGFDLLSIVACLSAAYSTILSNQTAFGVQNIIVEKGANIEAEDLTGSLRLLNINPGKRIEALQLTKTPAEVFRFIEQLNTAAEAISGQNAANRGMSKEASGSAYAFLHTAALEFNSGIKGAVTEVDGEWATHIVATAATHITTKRVATIAGRYNTAAAREFTGSDLELVSRVLIQPSNPLKDTYEGRLTLADKLTEQGFVKNPDQYLNVVMTGRYEPLLEGSLAQIQLIRRENERLLDGSGPVIALALGDDHAAHIGEHAAVLASPEVRENPALVNRVRAHITEHEMILRGYDPAMLQLMGQQPLPPIGAAPPGAIAPEAALETMPQGPAPEPMPSDIIGPGGGEGDMPRQPSMPVDPTTGQTAQVPGVPAGPPS
jgi:hypothetical protein